MRGQLCSSGPATGLIRREARASLVDGRIVQSRPETDVPPVHRSTDLRAVVGRLEVDHSCVEEVPLAPSNALRRSP